MGRVEGGEREPTLDGTGTLRRVASAPDLPSDPARLHVWGAVTLAYLAGVADAALDKAVEHAKSREQFGAPLAALPAVQAHLADAALARDGLLLSAWSAADPEAGFPGDSLAWAGRACREVTAHVQQVHGGIGFALEGGDSSVLPSRKDRAGVDGRFAAGSGLAPSDSWGAIVTLLA